jgi:hypothetical protein
MLMHENRFHRDSFPGGVDSERTEANPMRRMRLRHCEAVLNIVRASQPVARGDIARQSGLREGTVGVIVKELLREGMITEELSRAPRGRPRSMVSVGNKCDLSALDSSLE